MNGIQRKHQKEKMKAYEIKMFRERLEEDPDNRDSRRSLHEQFEWLEAYWQENYKGNNNVDKFCEEYDEFYWNIPDLKEVALRLAGYPPVGSSKNNFDPTESVQRATYFLRHNSDLMEDGFPEEDHEIATANKWTKSSFNALLTVVIQVRNNLFHGRKMDLEKIPYDRNKELVSMAAEIVHLILDKLDQAEAFKANNS